MYCVRICRYVYVCISGGTASIYPVGMCGVDRVFSAGSPRGNNALGPLCHCDDDDDDALGGAAGVR